MNQGKYKSRLVKFAYLLASSSRYHKIKNFFYDILENDQYPYKKYFDFFMIFIILSSVTILVIDVKEHIPQWLDNYDLYFVTTIFIFEYFLRMWIHNDIHKIIIDAHEESQFFDKSLSYIYIIKKVLKTKYEYITSLSAIIDLIAILPSYRGLRILRVLVLFRAFKMLRYARSLTGFLYVLKNKKFELITLLTLATFFIFISGIMLYVFEGANSNPNINNLFDAFYWALVTISTVGYGDISPVTPEGRAVSMLIIITGIGLISFITSVIVSSFSERLSTLREDRVVHEIGKKQNLTVVCGFGLLGQLVADGLDREGVEFLVLEKDESRASLADSKGYRSICTDATKGDIFKQLGVDSRIDNVLCLTSDDVQNAFIAINVKSLNKDVVVTARCSDDEIAEKLEFAGIDHVIMPEEIAGMMGAVYAGEPVAFKVVLSIIEEKEKTQIDEIYVSKGSFLENVTISEAKFSSMRLILLGVFRGASSEKNSGDFIFNPSDDFVLKSGDGLVCIGYSVAIANLKKKI
jgi:voltage-gated potassium channel